MKNDRETRTLFKSAQADTGNAKPSAPFSARQAVTDRRAPDPSSVLRSDRYPIPTFFEYRMRASE
jgi:hypothetical protein